jgi:hypothetical protein
MTGSSFRSGIWLSCLVLFAILGTLLSATSPAAALRLPSGHFPQLRSDILPAQFFGPRYYEPRYYERPRVYRPRNDRPRYRKRVKPQVATPKCEPPWTWSKGLGKCTCSVEGYASSGEDCVKLSELCAGNGVWSETEKICRCGDGLVLRDGQCIDPEKAHAALQALPGAKCFWPRVADDDGEDCQCAPGYRLEEASGLCLGASGEDDLERRRAAQAAGLLTGDIALIQQCLKEAGYLKGTIAADMTKRAWTAFWFFKQDHKVGPTQKGVHDPDAQKAMFELCPLAARAVKGTELAAIRAMRGAARGETGDAAATEPLEPLEPLRKGYARPESDCLPEDLLKLVTRSYGRRPDLKACTQTCVAVPRGISDREVALLERRGVKWCRDCLEIRTHLPLGDILRLERAGNLQICTRPEARLPRWQRADGAPGVAYTKVRLLYRALPPAVDHEGDIAVVIGNKNYQGGLPANESAHNNAGAMFALLSEHLGYRQENVIDLRDASLEDLTRVFGGPEGEGELQQRLVKGEAANVLIYYAGHGTTNLSSSESFLVPVDAVEHREERSSYPMSQLYANLARLNARSVMLFLEAGFGRDRSDFVFAPNLAELPVRSLPLQDIKALTVMSAAEGDQRTMDDPEFGIGLFTRYLIEGLAGKADLAPVGNSDQKVEAVELYAYTAHLVDLAARKSYGMLQKPQLAGKTNAAVSELQARLQ